MINLPITSYKSEIIEAVRTHAFTIITAETGSGKSTQVPQYLAEYFNQVIVTEPRIMAAKTLAKRVSEEMNVTLGMEVGYRTGYDKCSSSNSKIVYCTDGLQLIRTIFDENVHQNNVLIIDEVHEWNLNIEVLIAWCKRMENVWNTKVVIMSATMESDSLAKYFGSDVASLSIPGNLFDVPVEELPSDSFIDTIIENSAFGNVLAFVPGKKEIADTIKELEDRKCSATILPLHGEMDWEEQKRCFEHYSNFKVVVATNVAQTSLTISDIDTVVDTGTAKISIAENGIQGLYLKNISVADILQRKGRAGRTKDGMYFLCSDCPISYRSKFTVPEIQRSILDRVVLQLAAIGLDATELKFFHQPDISSIKIAKRELEVIGALKDNEVTELGYKIVKMPLAVQFARMIIEAEKYGVTEQVMTIAAIIEMGGLINKDFLYSEYTKESKSDLLAELDVWNALCNMGYINFEEVKVRKKSFFRIKEHIKKLREVLYGIVEMNCIDNRDAIVKSCICGLVSHVYMQMGRFDNRFIDSDGESIQLDRNSCLCSPTYVVGIPKTIQFKDRYGLTDSINLISFATEIEPVQFFEIAASSIKERKSFDYNLSKDAVNVITTKSFGGFVIDVEKSIDYHHPMYEKLKAEYEEELKKFRSYIPVKEVVHDCKEYVSIEGKQFEVIYTWDNKPEIYIDQKTLFTTSLKEVLLDTGEKVTIVSDSSYRRDTNIAVLKNAEESIRVRNIRRMREQMYAGVKVNSLDTVMKNSDLIGKIELTKDNGGYGDKPIVAYGCMNLKKHTVTFSLVDDEELANTNTLEALQYVFMNEIEKKYGNNKFSHQPGKKKKILTEAEKEVKKEFDSLVREVLLDLTIDKVNESLEFLDEYYHEIMGR